MLLTYFLLGITIPIYSTLIPLFQIYHSTGLLNSYLSLVLPQVGFDLPLSIYLFVAFYRYVPNSMIEAAVMDGAGVWRVFLSIMVPLSKNTIITVVTINSIFVWNEFPFANTFISSSQMKTVPIGLYDYIGAKGLVDWGATFSAISLFSIPLLAFYFFLNKSIVAGMAAGAIKE
jgi:raffinose/stachyose/melibiose transport system permease protein